MQHLPYLQTISEVGRTVKPALDFAFSPGMQHTHDAFPAEKLWRFQYTCVDKGGKPMHEAELSEMTEAEHQGYQGQQREECFAIPKVLHI